MAYASGRGPRPVEIIGHRGAPREFRENTLPSFRRAFDAGADAVELDVHGTADGHVVVHHDPATNSRPGESGSVVVIAGARLAEVRAVTVMGERIPTLGEVLSASPEWAIVYVEVKASAIEAEVVAAVRAGKRRCAIHSFDHRIVRRVGQLAPDIPTGILQTSYLVDPVRAMRDAGARDLWQHWELIDAALVERVHEDERRVIAWTVNEPALATRLIQWGVDGICTDTPDVVRALVGRGSSA